MSSPKRNRARILTGSGLKKLRERMRSHEAEENAGYKYTLERLGELTGLDPETVKNVVDCKGSDKRTIARCFETFGLTLEDGDHIPVTQLVTAPTDPNFVGRDEAIADLNELVSRNVRVIVIQARGGVGKTTLARKYLQQEFGSFLEIPIAKETKDIASIEGLIEEKLRQLGEEPGREFLVSLDRLKRKLQAERIGILIDNLEPALDSTGKFIEAHRRYVELLRVLSDPTVQSITLITSRERLREADVTVQHYPLKSLNVQAWEQFFQSRSIQLTPLSSDGKGVGGEGALAALHNAYGGNAKAMDIISGAVLEDFSGDVQAYWQANQDDLFIERDLEDLVKKQFNRLQQLDPDAYKLLCRMGCYRYQDVPTVPIEGLFCLLWDVTKPQQKRIIKALQDRSLVDVEDRDFWLHPVIRSEAIARLKLSQEWEKSNRKASQYWMESVQIIESTKDLLKGFEAYYHYIEIFDFDAACNVITRKRKSQWEWYNQEGGEVFGNAHRRLGLSQRLISAIIQIIDYVTPGYSLGLLYILLVHNHWITGNIRQAISSCEEAEKTSHELLEQLHFKDESAEFPVLRLNLASRIGKAHCKLDLLEVEEAKIIFNNILSDSKNTKHHNFVIESCLGLALIYSCSEMKEESFYFANRVYDEIRHGLDDKFSDWCIGHCFLFLGSTYKKLRDLEKASEMYNQSILFAERNYYRHIKAKALIGLEEIFREQKDFKMMLSCHKEAIKTLEAIDANFDLAESYYQLGLGHQAMGEAERSNTSFQEAIRLFSEMGAPRQVERVRRSMEGRDVKET